MSKVVAKFEKVSYPRFRDDYLDCFGIDLNKLSEDDRMDWICTIEDIHSMLTLPRRATSGSAGYDFFTPVPIVLKPGQTIKIPTGIRCRIENGYVLSLYPRSGLGFKYRLQLNNTVGIIDSDYYYSDNEGHIFAKITNDSNEGKIIDIKPGEAFMQGIFTEYLLAEEEEVTTKRNGGFGSTTK